MSASVNVRGRPDRDLVATDDDPRGTASRAKKGAEGQKQPKVIKSRQPSTSLLESDVGNPINKLDFSTVRN